MIKPVVRLGRAWGANPHAPTRGPVHLLILAGIGTGMVLVGGWLPWIRSGASTRNSFSVFRFLHQSRLVPIDNTWLAALRFFWLLTPFAFVIGVTFFVSYRFGRSALVFGLAGSFVVLVALVALLSFGLQPGLVVSAAGASICFGVSLKAKRSQFTDARQRRQ